jgi:quinol monooxygenase YgiN
MSEIIVVGSFKALPGKEEEALEAFNALVEPTHREEGCILYALSQGVDDPRDLVFVERWSSVEAHDAHMAAPHITAILERVPELFGEDANVSRYEERPAGEPKKGSLAAHAAV